VGGGVDRSCLSVGRCDLSAGAYLPGNVALRHVHSTRTELNRTAVREQQSERVRALACEWTLNPYSLSAGVIAL